MVLVYSLCIANNMVLKIMKMDLVTFSLSYIYNLLYSYVFILLFWFKNHF